MVHWIVFVIISISFLFSSFQQGLFYDQYIYTWHMGLAVLFLLYLVYLFVKKDEKMVGTAFFIFLLPLMYGISMFHAATMEGAFNQFIQWTLFAMFFFVLVHVKANQPAIQKGMIILLQLFGVYVAIFPFMTTWEWLTYSDAVLGDRYSSIFQYPNTYATVILAIFLFQLIYLLHKDTCLWQQVLLSLPFALYASTVFLSLSRGVMIILPVAWFLGLFFLRFSKQLAYILSSALAFLGGFTMYMVMIGEWGTFGAFGQFVMVVLISGGTTALIVVLHHLIVTRSRKRTLAKRWSYLIPGIAAVGGLALVLDFMFKGLIYRTLPARFQGRIDGIGHETLLSDGRFTFFSDAFAMLKDSFLFGWGGDAWRVLYHGYQSSPYRSEEIHSVVLEQLVNIGVVGVIVMMGVLLFYLGKSVAADRFTTDAVVPASFIALFMLVGHGAIDFDFSFATVTLLFFLFLAIAVPENMSLPARGWMKYRTPLRWGAVIGSVSLVIISTAYAFRFEMAERVMASYERENEREVLAEGLETAHDWNPYRMAFAVDLAALSVELRDEEKALQLGDTFIEIQPKSGYAWLQSGNSYASFDKYDEALARYEQALTYDPFNITIYQQIIRLTSEHAEPAYQSGAVEEAKEIAEKTTTTYEAYDTFTKTFRENPRTNYKNLTLNQLSYFLVGQAYVMREDYVKATAVLAHVTESEEEIYVRAQALLVHSFEALGETERARESEQAVREKYDSFDGYYSAYELFF